MTPVMLDCAEEPTSCTANGFPLSCQRLTVNVVGAVSVFTRRMGVLQNPASATCEMILVAGCWFVTASTEVKAPVALFKRIPKPKTLPFCVDRKSTRLNSSHLG